MELPTEPPLKRTTFATVEQSGDPARSIGRGWSPCPGCDRLNAQQPRCEEAHGDPEYYSTTHCCRACERGEPHEVAPTDPYRCVGIPRSWIRSVTLPGIDAPAHFICHVPHASDTHEAGAETSSANAAHDNEQMLPVMLYLHGAVTYLYPETLWPEVRNIIDRNSIAREKFIVVAAVGGLGEPIVIANEHRMKKDRSGDEVAYVQKFDAEKLWDAFQALCAAPLLPGVRADLSRLSVMGYSMGGQAVWDIARFHGQSIAAAVPFACACVWADDDWDRIETIQANLMHLPLRQHSGEADQYAYSWKDFMWIGGFRGLQLQEEKAIEAASGVSARSWCWGKVATPVGEENAATGGSAECSSEAPLELNLMNGTRTVHCCWEEVLHDESAFGLFSWLLEQRQRT